MSPIAHEGDHKSKSVKEEGLRLYKFVHYYVEHPVEAKNPTEIRFSEARELKGATKKQLFDIGSIFMFPIYFDLAKLKSEVRIEKYSLSRQLQNLRDLLILAHLLYFHRKSEPSYLGIYFDSG